MTIDTKTLYFATTNKNKVKEASKILSCLNIKVKPFELKNILEPEESGKTFAENAFIKATYYHNIFNKNCFAEDSGLMVESLNNEPGIFSKRYNIINNSAEKDINSFLLDKMDGLTNRKAKFVCFLSLFFNGKNYCFKGEVIGKIAGQKRGTNGFGYDPIFIPKNHDKTFAEIDIELKNKISHRTNALKKMILFLENYLCK